MSNGLNRKNRRMTEKQARLHLFENQTNNLREHLRKAEAEMKDSMEHVYTGLWWTSAAVAMKRARLSDKTIYRVLTMADQMYGELNRKELTVDDIAKEAAETAHMAVEFNVKRRYVRLAAFENGSDGVTREKHRYFDNITLLEEIV